MSDIKLFNDKNILLRDRFKEVNYIDFYRDIFPVGSFERKGKYNDSKGNGIAIVIEDDKYRRFTVTDELNSIHDLVKNKFVIMNAISYFGKERTMYNSNFLYAMVFDIDGLSDLDKLENLISHTTGSAEINPRPTYIVNSGHGVHLYYVFKKPVPLYNHLKEPLKELKYYLTSRLWNMYVSDIKEVQYQGLNQAFRMVGSPTKFGIEHIITAFKIGPKIDLDYLNQFVPDNNKKIEEMDYKSNLTLEEARIKYPEWYERRIINKQKSKTWTVKRDLYDWWLKKIKHEATYGHRYFCVMSLAIYAAKCNIPYAELEKDALSLIPYMNQLNSKESFTKYDVMSALNSYSEEFKTFPRSDIEKITSISIPKNKRNGRSQKEHIEIMNAIRDIMYRENDWRYVQPSKKDLVKEFIKNNPEATPTEISKKLGISRTTVYKYLK